MFIKLYDMKVVCAWCNTELYTVKALVPPGAVSHGICETCKEDILNDANKEKVA